MKKYIKPDVEVMDVKIESLLDTPSITSVTGLSDVEKGEGDFPGGGADSRMDYFWDDED
jgi:hypothetical protein